MTRNKRLGISGVLCVVAVALACASAWWTAGGSEGLSGSRPPTTGGAAPSGEQAAGTLVKRDY